MFGAARGGRVTLLTDPNGANRLGEGTRHCIVLSEVDPFIAPFIYSVSVLLLAYHTAALKGTDVDQPRNLAKSVTVA
jgi:glucosamine--fructose-6-phosphate aminotransferase (isomerizing)